MILIFDILLNEFLFSFFFVICQFHCIIGIFTMCKKRTPKSDPSASQTTPGTYIHQITTHWNQDTPLLPRIHDITSHNLFLHRYSHLSTLSVGIQDQQDSVVASSVQPGLGDGSVQEASGGVNQLELVSAPSSRLLFPSSLSPMNEGGYLDVEHGGVDIIGEPSLGQMSLHGSISLFTGSIFEEDSHVNMFVEHEVEGDVERGHDEDLEGKGFVGAQSQEITVGMTEIESFGK